MDLDSWLSKDSKISRVPGHGIGVVIRRFFVSNSGTSTGSREKQYPLMIISSFISPEHFVHEAASSCSFPFQKIKIILGINFPCERSDESQHLSTMYLLICLYKFR